MTILKNKFYIGQEVYYPPFETYVEITSFYKTTDDKLKLRATPIDSCYTNAFDESELYESKEAYEVYEKEKNGIRVGDEFYFIGRNNGKVFIKKEKADILDGEYIYNPHGVCFIKTFCFKTKAQLLAAVKKAVEECE